MKPCLPNLKKAEIGGRFGMGRMGSPDEITIPMERDMGRSWSADITLKMPHLGDYLVDFLISDDVMFPLRTIAEVEVRRPPGKSGDPLDGTDFIVPYPYGVHPCGNFIPPKAYGESG
jgi:hypothetical protein